MTAILMGIVGIKLAGGFLLLYVVWKFYKELRSDHSANLNDGIVAKATLSGAVWTIIIADISMSLDNVLAVAGAAHGNLAALTIGLIISIVLMAFASNAIAKMLDKYPQIQWLGLIVILFVATEMILAGSVDVEKNILHINLFPFIAFLIGGIFLILQQKYLKPINKERMRLWVTERLPLVLIFGLIFIVLSVHFGDIITGYLKEHSVLRWVISFGLFLAILESVSLLRDENKK